MQAATNTRPLVNEGKSIIPIPKLRSMSGSSSHVLHFIQIQIYCQVPPGTNVILLTYHLHRDPAQFGPTAHQFRPERAAAEHRDNYCYVPFSAGPRNCIGQRWAVSAVWMVCHLHRPRFALLEAKLVVARVLHRFHVSAVTPPEQLQASLLAELVLRPKQGLHVTFSRRHPPS